MEQLYYDDAVMMRQPRCWPRYPWLPVKRPRGAGFPECGVMYAYDEVPTVHLVNLFDLPETFEDFGEIPTITYPNCAAAVADGWVVD